MRKYIEPGRRRADCESGQGDFDEDPLYRKAIVDVMESRVDFLVADLATALPQIEAKKVKAFAVTSKNRTMQLPDVPTVVEAGIPDY